MNILFKFIFVWFCFRGFGVFLLIHFKVLCSFIKHILLNIHVPTLSPVDRVGRVGQTGGWESLMSLLS